jgi:hypothetical protein
MAYLAFDSDEGPVLVEVAERETISAPGVVKAGLGDRLQDNVSRAQLTLESALSAVIERSAGAFVRAVNSLDDPPGQIEVEFSVKATGELSNFAVGKLSGDANYAVKLTWSRPAAP